MHIYVLTKTVRPSKTQLICRHWGDLKLCVLRTFNHLSDLLFVQVVSLGVDESAQKVFEPVEYFTPRSKKWHPLTHWMTLGVL